VGPRAGVQPEMSLVEFGLTASHLSGALPYEHKMDADGVSMK